MANTNSGNRVGEHQGPDHDLFAGKVQARQGIGGERADQQGEKGRAECDLEAHLERREPRRVGEDRRWQCRS